ncbi:sensor histidine kinase response receiver, HAMP domain-containing [Citrifermentans bemidjiense Bem]|uniref:histidine kinase n=1 Tax=Citrifermentans bemidjiense (strain ATCC BAA-1014 / DSM 16622 / JCM 12645 / Bem) TaxID=404380 RepID=B5EGM0_CITBB|nr:response regulator [Citrifermentans bemidjiense]ACH39503.1 sensor histidine kinase response receiver, HAMP domain-containing [Citrifermentans bemidjiense Bem]
MKKLIKLPTLRARLAFWFTAICLVPLFLVTTIIYMQRVKLARSLMFDKLNAVTSLRQQQIGSILDNMIVDASTIASDHSVLETAEQLLSGAGGGRVTSESLTLLRGYQSSNASVTDVSIVSHDGTVVLCTSDSRIGTRVARPEMVGNALQDLAPTFGDAYLGSDGIPSIDVAVPIGAATKSRVGALLVARYNLHTLLYDITGNRTGMGDTGETVLVNREVMPLNELRAFSQGILKVPLKGKPAQMAARGESGIAQTTDYRGVDVLSAFVHIPRTGWGLVCKQDSREILAPIRSLLFITYGLAALISVFACLLAFRLARSIADPLVNLAASAKELEDGDFDARAVPEGTDEQKTLARSFNSMARTLQTKMAAQQGMSRLSQNLVVAEGMDDFFSKLLPVFLEITGARMAVAYVEERQTGEFAPMHAIGLDSSLLRRFQRRHLEGELGVILASGTVSCYTPQEGSPLRFATSFGEIVPAEIATVPISVDAEIRAFVSIASERPFPPKVHEILELVQMPLGAAFARILSGEDVRLLANELALKNEELTQQSEELVQQSTELAHQSEELSRHNQVLDLQKQQLEEATRLKSEFLSNMSHELRTPLNSVLALSRVLAVQGGSRLTEDEKGYLSIIERNGKHLLSLINDILDLAKIESGRQEVYLETVSLQKVTAEVVDGLSVLAREKGIAISLEAPEALPTAVIDVKRLRQMLQNLIGNAVKFTAEGAVTVRLGAEGEEFLVEVEDTGIGIAPQYLETIFHEFRQADGSTSRSFEGTGLGLAIVKKTARLLGGDVSVRSELGKGSVFTLRLPCDGTGSVQGPQASGNASFPAERAQAPMQGRSVLVVDDDPEAVSLIASHLSQAGFETLTALNGADALRLARAKKPFAITLDIMMPDMDGWEVMRELKDQRETADIPVVIVSLSDDRATGIALGAVGVIAKPVSREQLIETFTKLAGAGCRLVLVVDDSEYDRFFIASLFKEMGMDVLLAEDGAQALEIAAADRPDLITLDLLMPGMDGAAVLDKLRSNQSTAAIPVVVITSKDLNSAELERLSSGVSAILSKGGLEREVVLDELVHSLERIGWRLPCEQSANGARILIVEDSEAATIQLRFALESAGFCVDAVSGGRHALSYLKTHVPDGIILDLMMPEVDGFDVLKAVRASRLTEQVPVMVMTAKTLSPGEHDRLRLLEVNHLVQKGDVEQHELLRRVYEMLGAVCLFKPGTASTATGAALFPGGWQGDGSVLVVEDNPDNLVTLRAVLGEEYRLVEATDGESGLLLAQTGSPSLILLDMHLPGMDGLAVLRRLKQDNATALIPVVALTASAMTGDREMLMEAGCVAYVSKPYQPEELQELVTKFVAAGTAPNGK